MQIRTMQIEDYDAVFALWKSCSGMGLNDVDDSRSGIERFLQRNPETCLVAVEETAIIGAGTTSRRMTKTSRCSAGMTKVCRRLPTGKSSSWSNTALTSSLSAGIIRVRHPSSRSTVLRRKRSLRAS